MITIQQNMKNFDIAVKERQTFIAATPFIRKAEKPLYIYYWFKSLIFGTPMPHKKGLYNTLLQQKRICTHG